MDPDIDIDEYDVSLEHKVLYDIHEILGNAKRIQPFLNFASKYLEQKHFADYTLTDEAKKVKHDEAVQKTLLNEVLSFNQLKSKLNMRHNQQVYRWLENNAHTKLILKPLDVTGPQKKDNVRYIIKPNINVFDGNIVDTVDFTFFP